MPQEHIVRSYDEQLKALRSSIARMGGLVDEAIATAMDSLMRRNTEEAQQTVKGDQALDDLELQVEQEAIELLALRQPMAEDLRSVLAALKISTILERIGDFAANIAKRATVLNQYSPPVRLQPTIPEMGRLVRTMVQDAIDAYIDGDDAKALDVWTTDKQVDELYNSLFRENLTYMMEDPRVITPCIHLLFVAKNLERMGDHATNIAEIVHYMVTGQPLEQKRPKGDDTSYTLVMPPDGDNGESPDPQDLKNRPKNS